MGCFSFELMDVLIYVLAKMFKSLVIVMLCQDVLLLILQYMCLLFFSAGFGKCRASNDYSG